MALEPATATTGIKGAATVVVKPTVAFLRTQYARRGAEFVDLTTLGSAEPELNEAISVLRGTADGLPASLLARLKGVLSGRPTSYAEPEARQFVEDPRVAELIRSGAKRILRDDDIKEERLRARDIHADLFGGDGVFGERLIDEGIAFATLTLLAHLTPGDRQTIDLLATVREEMHERFDQMERQIGTLAPAGTPQDLEGEPFNNVVEAETLRLRRQRLLHVEDLPEQALKLGERIKGGLRLADDDVRAEACREIAVSLSRAGRASEAIPWIDEAATLGADVTCERARISISDEDWDEALRLLRYRSDPCSRSLLLDVLALRDGDGAALAHFDAHLTPSDLTGHAIQFVAQRLVIAGRDADALTLLEQASPAQISDNPGLLWTRARQRIARAVAPELGKRLFENPGLIPQPHDLHDDAEGRRYLERARADLQQLQPLLLDLFCDAFSNMVDINLANLSLRAGDEAERQVARAELLARIKDPAQAARLAPLAIMYNLPADWSVINASLAEAEKLGGYDDTQLQAAFTLKMYENDPAAIADFVHRYRARLDARLESGSVVGIEIEALAKSGRLGEAKALLESERPNLTEDIYSTLVFVLAELDGGDPVAVRLEQFQKSGATHELVLLVEAMKDAGDARLADHLIQLWHRRRQVSDAQQALDLLVRTGEEMQAEQFLDVLGDDARTDPMLRTHLAWARVRQGRLDEAEMELSGLDADGIDDVNTRSLRTLLFIETGRWAELEPFVQTQLAASAGRSAPELLGFARIARTIGSSTTLDLLRAAVAHDPANAAVNIQAYTIATEAGLDWSGEVNGWLSTAIASGDSDVIQSKKLEDVVVMVRESREEADRMGGLVNKADVPIFMAMPAIGGTQSTLLILHLNANAVQTDSRRRTILPLFAGNRPPFSDLEPKSVSFDPLALLVLDYLGLLEIALTAFDELVIPSGTLHSFFEDLAKASHSQPSRIAQASKLKDAVSNLLLTVERFEEQEGGAKVEDRGFAALFEAAEARDGYVVETAPLHPPGRVDEEVDPSPYSKRLLSPIGLVRSLRAAGVISRATAAAAESIVGNGAFPWPDEPVPDAGKPIFLTSLAAQNLTDAGLVATLKAHAGSVVVSEQTIDFADREIAQGIAAEPVRKGIERIRSALAAALASKRAHVGPARRQKDDQDQPRDGRIAMSPLMRVLRDAAGVQAVVCDDRAMNKYLQVPDLNGLKFTFLTTSDVIGILHRWRKIDDDELAAAREKLRKGGVGLMPLDPEELALAVRDSNWSIGPNAELRAIRDSIHLPLARGIVQLPSERPWFRHVALAISFAIRTAWRDVEDDADAQRAADYLLDLLPDPLLWSEGDNSPDRYAWIADVARQSLWRIASIFDLPPSRVGRYRQWFAIRAEPRFNRVDPGALQAVASSLYAFLTSPIDLKNDDNDA